jgi:short-subunit dehydrogenase
MTADEMVDASLAGLDQHELITIPSLPNLADWQKFDAARLALGPNLSHKQAADRYRIPQRKVGPINPEQQLNALV